MWVIVAHRLIVNYLLVKTYYSGVSTTVIISITPPHPPPPHRNRCFRYQEEAVNDWKKIECYFERKILLKINKIK